MPSVLPGYEYDIFISYRQKDNKYDGWVTEFVDHLKKELEATFKEDISVYFDINPHDGLLETHDVDESLKSKLKCLVFIPIISRTYCDPKSFAWEHEFKAFIDQASNDQFGLKVKLPNGNVASRVLPIRIHDLDSSDIKECESVLGGVLRGIEFIYKEPGVNKPLTADDDEKKNLNNTKYRIQINKVANAVKEIISGLKTGTIAPEKANEQTTKPSAEIRKEELREVWLKPAKENRRKPLYWIIGIVALVVIAAILAYPKIFKRDTLESLRASGKISLAVMPFQNLTNDTTWNIWQDIIQDNLITSLGNSKELIVRQREYINSLLESKGIISYASITPSLAGTVSQKLNANIFICGSIIPVGSTIRINTQLIDSKTKSVYKTIPLDGTAETIWPTIDILSRKIRDTLIISLLEKDVHSDIRFHISTKSPEAYKDYINGFNAFKKSKNSVARDWFLKAIAIDSNFVSAYIGISQSYFNQYLYDQGKEWCLKIWNKKDQVTEQEKIWINALHAVYFETPNEQIRWNKETLEYDDQQPIIHYQLGFNYSALSQYDKAIPEFEKSLEIHRKWGLKPLWAYSYTQLGFAYHKTRQYKQEKKTYKKAQQDFPDDPVLIFRQAVLALTEGKTKDVEKYIEKFKSIGKDQSVSEAILDENLGAIYYEAGILDKAEGFYRQAVALEPENPWYLNMVAATQIITKRNPGEGIQFADRALQLLPDHYELLDTKGWGLFQQGKFQEAYDILQKSWVLRLQKAVYDYQAFLRLEEAKKAVQKLGVTKN